MTGPEPLVPRYAGPCVAGVVPAAVSAVAGLGGRPRVDLPLPAGVRAVVVLVVDGLGRRQLDAHADVAPFLTSRPGPVLDAPFPTTTTTSLTSIGTGLPPGEHGIVGYSLAIPGDDRPLVALTWSWERQDVAFDARGDVDPETFQPASTAFERARAAGVRAVTVLRPEFTASGLTRAGLRGGEVVTAAGWEDTITAALAAAEAGGPTVVYAHHGDLDAIGHVFGPGSDQWCTELARIDVALARIADGLSGRVALVVTADHGMVSVPPEGFVELADRPDLMAGVRVLTGDGRARQLHAADGAAGDVLAAWREACANHAHVRSRDEAIDAGWFGPVAAHVRPRIGDVVVSARHSEVAWVHRDADLVGGRLAGLHGALTDEEREVPAIVLGGDPA